MKASASRRARKAWFAGVLLLGTASGKYQLITLLIRDSAIPNQGFHLYMLHQLQPIPKNPSWKLYLTEKVQSFTMTMQYVCETSSPGFAEQNQTSAVRHIWFQNAARHHFCLKKSDHLHSVWKQSVRIACLCKKITYEVENWDSHQEARAEKENCWRATGEPY